MHYPHFGSATRTFTAKKSAQAGPHRAFIIRSATVRPLSFV